MKRRVFALFLAITLLGGAVTLVTLWLPGRGADLTRRLERSWPWGRLEVGRARVTGLRTIELPDLRVWSEHRSEPIFASDDVRWRRAGALPTQDGLDRSGWEFELDRGTLVLDVAADGVWGVESSGRVVDLPGRIWARVIDVRVLQPEAPPLEWSLLDPTLVRASDRAVLTAGLAGASWSEGELRWNAGPDGWTVAIDLDDVVARDFPLAAVTRAFALPWSRAVRWSAGRLDLNWRIGSSYRMQSPRVDVECYQAVIELPEEIAPGELRFVRGGGTLEQGEVRWRLDRGTYSRSDVRGSGVVGPKELEAEIIATGVAGDRALAAQLPPMWSRLFSGTPWTGSSTLTVRLGGPRGGDLSTLFREARLVVENLARRGDEAVDSVAGAVTVAPEAGSWFLDGRLEPSKIRGLTIPSFEWEGRLSTTSLALASTREDLKATLRVDRVDEGALRFSVATGAFEIGPMLDSTAGGRWSLEELTGSWRPGIGLVWDARVSIRDLIIPEGTHWPWGDDGPTELGGTLVVHGERGRIDIPYLTLESDGTRWEFSGELAPDGDCRLEGFRVPRARVGFRRYVVPLEGATRVTLRGPVLGWAE